MDANINIDDPRNWTNEELFEHINKLREHMDYYGEDDMIMDTIDIAEDILRDRGQL